MRSLFLCCLLFPSIAFAAPRRHANPTPTPNPPPEDAGPTRQELFQTVDHIVRLSQDLQKNLDAEKAAHETTELALKKANTENFDLQKKIDKETLDFNATKDSYARANKKLWWYRIHFFLGWVLFATGIIAAVTIWILKITGKLAIVAGKL